MENQTLQSLNKCYKCFRPFETCYCKDIVSIKTGIKFVFLMHPKEAYKQKTGTGRLAHLTLEDSEIIVGVDFTDNPRLNTLITDEKYFPVVMYPYGSLTPAIALRYAGVCILWGSLIDVSRHVSTAR